MNGTRLFAVLAAALFLRWLATGHVTVTAGSLAVTVPALAIAAVTVAVVTAAVAALVVYRVRAERDMLAAWRPSKLTAR